MLSEKSENIHFFYFFDFYSLESIKFSLTTFAAQAQRMSIDVFF